MKTAKRIMLMLSITALLCCLLSVAAFAAGSGDVAGAVESTWTAASGQIKSVVKPDRNHGDLILLYSLCLHFS